MTGIRVNQLSKNQVVILQNFILHTDIPILNSFPFNYLRCNWNFTGPCTWFIKITEINYLKLTQKHKKVGTKLKSVNWMVKIHFYNNQNLHIPKKIIASTCFHKRPEKSWKCYQKYELQKACKKLIHTKCKYYSLQYFCW